MQQWSKRRRIGFGTWPNQVESLFSNCVRPGRQRRRAMRTERIGMCRAGEPRYNGIVCVCTRRATNHDIRHKTHIYLFAYVFFPLPTPTVVVSRQAVAAAFVRHSTCFKINSKIGYICKMKNESLKNFHLTKCDTRATKCTNTLDHFASEFSVFFFFSPPSLIFCAAFPSLRFQHPADEYWRICYVKSSGLRKKNERSIVNS